MKVPYKILVFTLLMLNSLFVTASTCIDPAAPVTSVADFDSSGKVDGKDIALFNRVKKNGIYSPLYDRDGNGVLDNTDRFLASRDISLHSDPEDQALAITSNEILAGTCVPDTGTGTGAGGGMDFD